MAEPVRVTAAKEFGLRGWTVRINGAFVADFYREISARRLAMRLSEILRGAERSKGESRE